MIITMIDERMGVKVIAWLMRLIRLPTSQIDFTEFILFTALLSDPMVTPITLAASL
jgi:hypothetical protein